MNTHPSKSPVFLPQELITEGLSFLPVKSLIRMKCVSKSWNSLISDPIFIKLHLHRSARNPYLALLSWDCTCVISIPVSRLLENPPITLPYNPSYPEEIMGLGSFVGSCNGLLCFNYFSIDKGRNSFLYFYNPSTNIVSKKFFYSDDNWKNMYSFYRYTFGYDNSTDTYKVVMYCLFCDNSTDTKLRTRVRVFSLGDNVWRDIEDFIVAVINHGVYLSGSVNWLALKDCFDVSRVYDSKSVTLDQFVIISLDLSTETHMQLLPPRGFDEVPHVEPAICVLMNSLCFCHDFQQTHFVTWQMNEFGIEEFWTQLLKISYQNLQPIVSWLPLHLSQNHNTLILANKQEDQAIIYNQRDNRIDRIITNRAWWAFSKNHVESLVSIC